MNRLAWVLGFLVLGCGASGVSDTTGTSDGCLPGDTRPCDCDGGTPGTETCSETGWGACVCAPEKDAPTFEDDASVPEDDGPAVCGDFRCDTKKGETCEDCPMDCGKCPECDLAPTCSGAFSIPVEFTPLPEFNNNGQTNYGSGVGMGVPPEETTCTPPRLKIQLSQIKVHKNGISGINFNDFQMFCVIEATDQTETELILTPTSKFDDGDQIEVQTAYGIFWGQGMSTLKQSQFNLTITYNCYRDKKGDAWADILKAVGDAAGAGAAIPGNPYGWGFGLGSLAANAAQAAIQQSGVENVLSVEQRIDKDALLLLTHGRSWQIRQSGKFKEGTFGSEKSDIELTVRAWGCSTPRPLPPQ